MPMQSKFFGNEGCGKIQFTRDHQVGIRRGKLQIGVRITNMRQNQIAK